MFKKIVITAAAIAIGAVFLFLPVSMFVSLGVAVAIALAATGALRAAASGPLAAPSLAIAFAVACICFTVIVLADISARAPVRISQEQLDREKATALSTGKALASIDVGNANARAAVAERALSVAAGQRDAAEAKVATLSARLRTAPAQVARAEPVGIPSYVAPERTAMPSPQWRSYREDRLLIASQFVSGTVRADCSQPAKSRAIEWSRTGSNWQPLRDAEYVHRAEEHGAMACAG